MKRLIYVMLLLSGCATIVHGTTQALLVDPTNAAGANCRGTDRKGREYRWVNTPDATYVRRGAAPLIISCEKSGFKKTIFTVEETITGFTVGNIITGGPLGLIIDIASGAASEYPVIVRFLLEPDDSASEKVKKEYQAAKKKLLEEQRTD